MRMPESMLNQIRVLANKRDVPYQSLIKVFLHERIDKELAKAILSLSTNELNSAIESGSFVEVKK